MIAGTSRPPRRRYGGLAEGLTEVGPFSNMYIAVVYLRLSCCFLCMGVAIPTVWVWLLLVCGCGYPQCVGVH